MSRRAVVRAPGKKYCECISSHPQISSLNLEKAIKQHNEYCQVLSDLGIEIIRLMPDDLNPDSCFVEDTAVIFQNKAFMTRPFPESRRPEIESIEEILKQYMPVKRATSPATIEGGDVIHLPNHLISGITQRTNLEGVQQMGSYLETNVMTIADSSIIHLKSHVTYLANNQVLCSSKYANHPILNEFVKLLVPENESYAANSLTVDESVLLPEGNPETKKMIKNAGFDVITLDMSEFEKCEGALTCISLLF